MIFDMFKNRRRQELRTKPLPDTWREIVDHNAPFGAWLASDARSEWDGLIQLFLDEKKFEGCGGLEMDDAIRVTVAAHACALLLGRGIEKVYPLLQSVLVYPASFKVDKVDVDEAGLVTEGEEEMLGESWQTGALVLSWEDILEDLDYADDGCNVVLHEFVHQLDDESGEADGTPLLDDADQIATWHEVMGEEFERLRREADAGRRTFLDEYGSESPTEFFAVATEAFFLQGKELRRLHPTLYDLLSGYYRLETAAWPWDDLFD